MSTDQIVVANPFGAERAIQTTESTALVAIEQQRAIAETKAAMAIAKQFPRDPVQAMDRILTACARTSLAEQALYSYSRGGAEITGPSIRMAEALAQAWGNLQFGVRELEQRNGESTIEAYAWDVETNVKQVKTFAVPHVRHTKKGTHRLEDPRDIYETVANQGARRLRACILGVIPGDVVEAAVKQCEQTLTQKTPVTPARITAVLDGFAQFGVTREQIEKRIQRRVDALTPALLVQLGKVYNSLRDGMSSAGDWFDALPVSTEHESRTESLKAKLRPLATKPVTAEPADGDYESAEQVDSIEDRVMALAGEIAIADGVTVPQVLMRFSAYPDGTGKKVAGFKSLQDAQKRKPDAAECEAWLLQTEGRLSPYLESIRLQAAEAHHD